MVDPNPTNVEPMPVDGGRTALHYAASTGDCGAVAELLAAGSADANGRDAVGYSAVQIAAAEGHLDVLRLLLRHQADVNLHDNLHGNTALHEASWKGYSKTVALLASSGSDLNRKNYGGSSALHLCCQNGHNQSCRELLLAGCDPDVQNNYGDTPLHTSARYGHAGVLRILLSAECKVSEQNKNGDTVLHIAAAMARKKLTKIILHAKCNTTLKNKQNETAKDIAERKNLTDILNILNDPVFKKKGSSSKKKKDLKDSKTKTDTSIKKQWSPYGCHYFPDTKEFPKPKLNSLPEEPLYAGEQYYLDLAGNIKKGPVGVGYTCYCAPFFKELEARLDHNTKKLKRQICRTEDNINRRLCSVEKQLKRSNEKLQQVTEEVASEDDDDESELLKNRFRAKCTIDTTAMDPNLRWRLDYLTARQRPDDIPCNDSGYSTKMFSNSQGPSPSLSNLMENSSVTVIPDKMPKSLSVLPDNDNMESIV